MEDKILIRGQGKNWRSIVMKIYIIGAILTVVWMAFVLFVLEGGYWSLEARWKANARMNMIFLIVPIIAILIIGCIVFKLLGRMSIVVTDESVTGIALGSKTINLTFEDIQSVKVCSGHGIEINSISGRYKVLFIDNNNQVVEAISEVKNLMEGAKYKLFGVNGQLFVFDNKIVIERNGVLGFLSQGMAGSKTIPMNNIMSVQYQEGNGLTNGFIQFGIMGGKEAKGGLFSATDDENTIMISASDNQLGRQIKEYVEDIILNRGNGGSTTIVQQQVSNADEIKKYKELLDSGIISQDEFEKKKKQLLGI